jgi:hypothetical protein
MDETDFLGDFMRPLRSALGATMAALAFTTTAALAAPAAHADSSEIDPGTYSIKSVAYISQVMTAPDSGTQVVGQREAETPPQYWDVEPDGRYDTIQNVGTGQYLAWDGGHVIVSQNPADWNLQRDDRGRFKIEAADDGRVVYLTGRYNGARADLTNYTSARDQQWYFQNRDDA